MATAAVLTAVDTPLEIHTDVEIADPQPGEVRVRTGASGVCHSDVSVANGTIPLPTPIVLGHEGSGIVEAIGEGVTNVAVGDKIVVSWVPQCGQCYMCNHGQPYLCEKNAAAAMAGMLDGSTRLTSAGTPLHVMGMAGSFADTMVLPDISVVKVGQDVPLPIAALIGCGVLTGVGAAINTADIREGDTVAVIGCGGVGLNVIQGAKIAGASEIIAVDMVPAKLEMAAQFGATTLVNGAEQDPVGVALGNGRGADVAFEVIGLGATMEQAINMVRPGGEVVLVGVPRLDVFLNLNAAFTFLYTAKTVKGCWYGSADVNRDVPILLDLYGKGELKLDELISATIPLEAVNEAFDTLATGAVARSVIDYGIEG